MIKKISILIVLLIALVSFYYWFGLKPVGRGEEKIFVINRGESILTIAQRLEKENLIRDKWVFLLYLQLKNRAKKIQAGSFRISPSNSLTQIVDQLEKGRLDTWLTVIEGWRREEIAKKAAERLPIDQSEFVVATRGKEGYLFPDSYLIPVKTDVEGVVKILEKNFQKKWRLLQKEAARLKLTQEQIVTLASLVEREVKFEQDRPIVAGILIKRWQAGWPLQVDATIQYAKANFNCRQSTDDCDWWPRVVKADLKIDSPYNTYLYRGLPPTPICNPSLSSLRAVINYQPSDYWFYLSDSSGKIHFAKTLEEHQLNIKKYIDQI